MITVRAFVMCCEAIFHMVWFFLVVHPWAPYYCWLPATGIAIYCVYIVVQELRAHRRDQLTERPNRIDLILEKRRQERRYEFILNRYSGWNHLEKRTRCNCK